jgi:hypothetical protein
MDIEETNPDVSAALSTTRRRARYLAKAEGEWTWSEVAQLAFQMAMAAYFLYRGAPNWDVAPIFGLILFVSAIGGWQIRRLRARVDALTRLLSDIGYSAEV